MKPTTTALLVTALLGVAACHTTAPISANAAQFDQADSNHDGRLNKDEYDRLLAIRAAGGDQAAAQIVKSNLKSQNSRTWFRGADTNHDGYLSHSELGM